ncbi:MAG: ComC/BlpC family leader-containing pheromone/bacteriocin [Microcoleus sp. SIO2G3]|nr:ComC/BlpC family leader-containing pheromone/bacteriocin [Microcoleus sp. SIO2G3]
MSNIKNADLQPANTVDEVFTELTNEELSQVSGGGFSLSDWLKGFNFSFNDGETTVLVNDGNVDVKTP